MDNRSLWERTQWRRTGYIGDFSIDDIGREAVICGWVHGRKSTDGTASVFLRDRSGIMEVVLDGKDGMLPDLHRIHNESVITARGTLEAAGSCRQEGSSFSVLRLRADSIRVRSLSNNPPFEIWEDSDVREDLRARYPYLFIRRKEEERKLFSRNEAFERIRGILRDEGFLEADAVISEDLMACADEAEDGLCRLSGEDGKDTVLGKLLMAGGLERCFFLSREQGLHAFLSFADEDTVMELADRIVNCILEVMTVRDVPEKSTVLGYSEAMRRFGSYSPVSCRGMEITDMTEELLKTGYRLFQDVAGAGGRIMAMHVRGAELHRKDMGSFIRNTAMLGPGRLSWVHFGKDGIRASFGRFASEDALKEVSSFIGAEEGDSLIIAADEEGLAVRALGMIRETISERISGAEGRRELIWINELPLFHMDEDGASAAHPLACPVKGDEAYLLTDPARVRVRAFRLLMGGTVTGSGCIMNDDADIQEDILRAIGMSGEEIWKELSPVMTPLKYGMPPHAEFWLDICGLLKLLKQS